jgi:hypothetical protein
MMSERLAPAQMDLLREVVEKHAPALLPLLEGGRIFALSDDDAAAFSAAIADEFIATGLQADDEPNDRGLALEELVDKVFGPRTR